tara:strand:+ start:155 stop:331 length:177 start_codon:yes stop_codon:yes gene_type:complete
VAKLCRKLQIANIERDFLVNLQDRRAMGPAIQAVFINLAQKIVWLLTVPPPRQIQVSG